MTMNPHNGWKNSRGFTRGRALVHEVVERHRLHSDDFYGRARWQYLVAARKEAAIVLRDAGYSLVQIGVILNRNHTTILSYLPDGKRAKQRSRAGQIVLKHLCGEEGQIVREVARAEGVCPSVLIAQWVGERARYEAIAKTRAD